MIFEDFVVPSFLDTAVITPRTERISINIIAIVAKEKATFLRSVAYLLIIRTDATIEPSINVTAKIVL